MKPSYILIDFENVQPASIGALDAGAFKIKVFVGARQSRVALELASALQPMGNAVEYVQIEGSGRNALDLHIAYYIGRLSIEEPGAIFHIVSKDTDYDPLIKHLDHKKINCQRWSAFSDIPHARAVAPKPVAKAARSASKPKPTAKVASKDAPTNHADKLIDNLKKRVTARPSTLKALSGTIRSLFRSQALTDTAVNAIIDDLIAKGTIAVHDGRVTYR